MVRGFLRVAINGLSLFCCQQMNINLRRWSNFLFLIIYEGGEGKKRTTKYMRVLNLSQVFLVWLIANWKKAHCVVLLVHIALLSGWRDNKLFALL